ncbi:unnamed protein product [Hymenolepis diminuta]|uniref:Homeobox domain-containing protein n=1 Tax=Hymenolepis diminuta TaxID=6216 RepID=A0A564YQY8_HYMDI|nr:unnamed protein product [Hymenolepis diminuta]
MNNFQNGLFSLLNSTSNTSTSTEYWLPKRSQDAYEIHQTPSMMGWQSGIPILPPSNDAISIRISELFLRMLVNTTPWYYHLQAYQYMTKSLGLHNNIHIEEYYPSHKNEINDISTARSCDRTSAVLRAWLADHRDHPYPTRAEKTALALTTNLSLSQVSTWFANARRRLKKETEIRRSH